MWIFTNKGFLSAVEDRNNAEKLIVRARSKQHLRNIFGNEAKIEVTPTADYRYRVSVDKKSFAELIKKEVENISYDNFKNSIKEEDYHHAASEVWMSMRYYQMGVM